MKRGGFARFFARVLFNDSFCITFWNRIGTWLSRKRNPAARLFYYAVKCIYKLNQYRTGIQLPIGTNVDGGLKFFHYNCIIVAQSVKIGRNCSIHQGVTIGRVFNGQYAGVPQIGDYVVIFAGAKVLGNVKIGNNAVIGANAVVTKNVPANAVVAGVPAKVVSENSDKCFDEHWAKIFGR